jgi:hypothetical protein
MRMATRLFHCLSYLKYIFYAWGCVTALPELVRRSDQLLENVGLGLFLIGMGLALEGFQDTRLSPREIRQFRQERWFRRTILFSTVSFCLAIIVAVFLFLAWLVYPGHPPVLYAKIREIGYGALALGIGGISMTKQKYDRFLTFHRQETGPGRD